VGYCCCCCEEVVESRVWGRLAELLHGDADCSLLEVGIEHNRWDFVNYGGKYESLAVCFSFCLKKNLSFSLTERDDQYMHDAVGHQTTIEAKKPLTYKSIKPTTSKTSLNDRTSREE